MECGERVGFLAWLLNEYDKWIVVDWVSCVIVLCNCIYMVV